MRFVRAGRLTALQLEQLRSTLRGCDYSYVPGILAGPTPRGFQINEHRYELGSGPEVWARARTALAEWAHFDVGWAGIATGGEPPHPDQIVVVNARSFGVTFLAPCRVLATHDHEDDDSAAFGFTYGTLPGHVAVGEERFEVTMDKATGVVAYQLCAMAAPGTWFTRLGRPLVDMQRARFRRDSGLAMARRVNDATAR